MSHKGTPGDPLEDLLRGRTHAPDIPDQVDVQDPYSLSLKEMDGSAATRRPANKEIARLHVIDSKGNVRTFEYDHLDVEHRFSGGKFTLIFAGTKHWRIDVEGYGDLWRVYDYCTLRRWPYLREAAGSMPDVEKKDGETVLTKIEIHDVTPKLEG